MTLRALAGLYPQATTAIVEMGDRKADGKGS